MDDTHLRSSRITSCPCEERHGECDSLLRLSCSIAADEGVDQVALRKVELSAVECNEQANAIRSCGCETIDDGGTDDWWTDDVSRKDISVEDCYAHMVHRCITRTV